MKHFRILKILRFLSFLENNFLHNFLYNFLENFLNNFLETFIENFLNNFLDNCIENFLNNFLDIYHKIFGRKNLKKSKVFLSGFRFF